MPRTLENPDRDFSAVPIDEPEPKDLRDLLKKSEVADILDAAVRKRVGELIGSKGARPAKQRW
jgi:hypothetical protein